MVATLRKPMSERLQLIEKAPTISSDRYNRIVFDEFGEPTGFDAAYILADDGAIIEAIAEPELRTLIDESWNEAAFIQAIDRWVRSEFTLDELGRLQLQLLPEGPATSPCQLLRFID